MSTGGLNHSEQSPCIVAWFVWKVCMHLQQIKSTWEVSHRLKASRAEQLSPLFISIQDKNAAVLQNLILFAAVKNSLNSILHEDCGDLLGYFIHRRLPWLFRKCWWIQRPKFCCWWQLQYSSRNVLNVLKVGLREQFFLFLLCCYSSCLHCWLLGWQDGTETGSPIYVHAW